MGVRVVKRRNVLQLFALGVVGATIPTGQAAGNERSWSIGLYQDDEYVELEPLRGEDPVEDFYGYAYPVDEYDGSLGADGLSYSSEGTVDLQRDDTSVLFLYEGPDGLSLVVVHGHLYGGEGGAVTFTVHGLSGDGEWIVMDDYLLDAEGNELSEDWWDVGDNPHVIDWVYEPGETDGGVFWPLEADFEIRLEPAFNDEAYFADECDCGPIERWEALSGELSDPDRYSLKLDREVVVRGVKEPTKSEKKPVQEEKVRKRPRKKREKETVQKKPEKVRKKPEKKKAVKERVRKPEKKKAVKERVRKPEKEKPKEVTKEKPERKEKRPKKEEEKKRPAKKPDKKAPEKPKEKGKEPKPVKKEKPGKEEKEPKKSKGTGRKRSEEPVRKEPAKKKVTTEERPKKAEKERNERTDRGNETDADSATMW